MAATRPAKATAQTKRSQADVRPSRATRLVARLTAPLSPDSPDPDARADATNPALMAELAASRRRAEEDGGSLTVEELDRQRPMTAQEIAETDAWLDQLERDEETAVGAPAPRPRPSGRRPTAANGKVLLRLPLSVHQELIERADAEQTSLNQLVLSYISRGLGQDAGPAR